MSALWVRDEHAPRFGRQVLTLWSGPFAEQHEGWATELPGHDGFMVRMAYTVAYPSGIRVACEAPRTDDNFERVDRAIESAVLG